MDEGQCLTSTTSALAASRRCGICVDGTRVERARPALSEHQKHDLLDIVTLSETGGHRWEGDQRPGYVGYKSLLAVLLNDVIAFSEGMVGIMKGLRADPDA